MDRALLIVGLVVLAIAGLGGIAYAADCALGSPGDRGRIAPSERRVLVEPADVETRLRLSDGVTVVRTP
jgi:hypothetical protein